MAVTQATCSGCGQEIVFIDTSGFKKMPCDPKVVVITADDGQTYRGRVSHFATCSKPGRGRISRFLPLQFRKPVQREGS
jgi:hypothetical protein